METITRHWHILRQIPRYPRKTTAGAIHQNLQRTQAVSKLTKRTIERDLHALAGLFPLEFDGCKPQGWCWRRDAEQLDIPGMDLTAALTFRMAEEYLSRLLPQSCLASLEPHMQRARAILGDPGHGGLADWPEKVKIVPRSQPLLPPSIEPQVLEVVYEALLRDRRFKGFYQRQGEERKEFEINPLGLVFNDPVAYVVATCWDYEDVRLLALHRFTSAELLDKPVTRPADFDLQRYIDGGALGFSNEQNAMIRLKARFTRAAAAHLRESRLSEDQTMSNDGDDWVVVEATVADTEQLRWWLQGFGAQVEVLRPESLREEFVATARKIISRYGLALPKAEASVPSLENLRQSLDAQGRLHGDPLSQENLDNLTYAYEFIHPTNHTEAAFVVWAGSQQQSVAPLVDEYCRRRSGEPSRMFDHPLLQLQGWCQPETHRVLIFREHLESLVKELTGGNLAREIYRGEDAGGCSLEHFRKEILSIYKKKLSDNEIDDFYLYLQRMYAPSRQFAWCSTIVERALSWKG